jgi:hypothetical protein
LRIWDLRRGDDDDDRTNPHRRGVRSLLASAVLEFNYLKAPIGFLALFVVPALLIGAAPSLAIAYGRLILHAPELAGRSLIVTPIIILMLIAIAVCFGGRVFSVAWNNFWHLHYSLVLPVFVALREVLRGGAEKLLGRSMTAEQLDRSRRICAVIAAVIFVVGGLAVAIVTETTLKIRFLDVVELRWRPLAAAALANAAVILGLSAALESLFWIWRELSLNSPVLDWTAAPTIPGAAAIRVAHLSDLHIVGERYGLQTTQNPWVILLHHQVVEYPRVSVTLRERIVLCSAPSTSLGADGIDKYRGSDIPTNPDPIPMAMAVQHDQPPRMRRQNPYQVRGVDFTFTSLQ